MTNTKEILKISELMTLRLLDICRIEKWRGWDPYDALNSRLLEKLPFLDKRITRLLMIQSMKRCPINLRRFLLVPKTMNPKALALFLSSLIKLSKLGLVKNDLIFDMIKHIRALRSQGSDYWCWGYSFPWQTRTILVPRGEPNLVCTTFVANALIDAYESGFGPDCLDMARSAAQYIADELYWTGDDTVACFCYPTPSSRTRVHNANFLGSALLCRIYKYYGDDQLIEKALKVIRYSISKQEPDGSWYYGEHHTQKWIDNFHTGYNLCALDDIRRYAQIKDLEPYIEKGIKYYLINFFEKDGVTKYFHNKIYPIDAHCVAQSIITLTRFKESYSDIEPSIAFSVLNWCIDNLLSDEGYFYYQKTAYLTNKISYMRWTHAWMLYAMATLLEAYQG